MPKFKLDKLKASAGKKKKVYSVNGQEFWAEIVPGAEWAIWRGLTGGGFSYQIGTATTAATAEIFAAAPETAAELERVKAVNVELAACLRGVLFHGKVNSAGRDDWDKRAKAVLSRAEGRG